MKKHTLRWMLSAAMVLCGCSINISQGSNPSAAPLATASLGTPVPGSPINAAPPSSGAQIGDPSLPTTSVPVTWGDLNLSGKLVFMNSVQTQSSLSMSINALDLSTGVITTVFQAPDTAWIDFMSVSPDESQLVMAYLPPRDTTPAGTKGQQGLYTLPLDGSGGPQLILTPPSAGDQYFQPTWSPDGKYIYFSVVDYNAPPQVQGQHYSYYEAYRMAYPGGEVEKMAEEAYWPRLSRDGARLAFVTLDPVDGSNKLFVANGDGSGARQVILSGLYVPPIIDAPIFTPDDQTILYSAVSPTSSYQPNWLDRLTGLIIASAHTVPSDWWSVPIGGGTPTQLTHLAVAGLFGSLSPDGQYMASYSGNGIFVMKPDGTELTTLVSDMGGLAGTVNWIR